MAVYSYVVQSERGQVIGTAGNKKRGLVIAKEYVAQSVEDKTVEDVVVADSSKIHWDFEVDGSDVTATMEKHELV